MNRHYTTADFEATVERLRKYFANCAVTTDVIVGFPGETEEEFEETREYLERLGLYEMHIFKYSKRQGTRAAVMPEQVPDQIKAKRSDILLEMEERFSKQFRESFIGKELEVLIEEEKQIEGKTYMVGHSKEYICVAVAGNPLPGTVVKIKPSGIFSDGKKLFFYTR